MNRESPRSGGSGGCIGRRGLLSGRSRTLSRPWSIGRPWSLAVGPGLVRSGSARAPARRERSVGVGRSLCRRSSPSSVWRSRWQPWRGASRCCLGSQATGHRNPRRPWLARPLRRLAVAARWRPSATAVPPPLLTSRRCRCLSTSSTPTMSPCQSWRLSPHSPSLRTHHQRHLQRRSRRRRPGSTLLWPARRACRRT